MTIREAEEQDFSAICTLMKNELGYSDLNEVEAINRMKYFSDNNDWITYVAVGDCDEIIGFIGVIFGICMNRRPRRAI